MSNESIQWLNDHTAIGDTDLRASIKDPWGRVVNGQWQAWHYRMGSTNHYPGAVPMDVVEGLICPWEPTRRPLYIKQQDGTFIEVPNFIGMAAEKAPDELYAIHSGTYEIHPFRRWLIENVQRLVDKDDLHVSSAMVLAKGSVAAIELAISDVMTVEGFDYRPHLLAITSANGRYETSYGRKIQASICDNSLDIADREVGARISYRHTKGSVARIKDVAEATGLIMSQAAAFDEEVKQLLSWKVPTNIFSRWLDEMIPEKGKDGHLLNGAALTRVEKKREGMVGMWNNDPRVSPWNGTALGVLQLNNTWNHHNTAITKATAHRVERNMINTISGKTGELDFNALGILSGLSQAYGFKVPDAFTGIPVPQLVTL